MYTFLKNVPHVVRDATKHELATNYWPWRELCVSDNIDTNVRLPPEPLLQVTGEVPVGNHTSHIRGTEPKESSMGWTHTHQPSTIQKTYNPTNTLSLCTCMETAVIHAPNAIDIKKSRDSESKTHAQNKLKLINAVVGSAVRSFKSRFRTRDSQTEQKIQYVWKGHAINKRTNAHHGDTPRVGLNTQWERKQNK